MAIIDKNKNKIVDRDENQSIGFKLPFVLDNGWDSMTKETLESIKQNVLNLCSTEMGERIMQPTLGIKLRKFLFEPFSEDVVFQIKNSVLESIAYWLPFVKVENIDVKMSDTLNGNFKSTMEVYISFSLKNDPTALESVQITIGE